MGISKAQNERTRVVEPYEASAVAVPVEPCNFNSPSLQYAYRYVPHRPPRPHTLLCLCPIPAGNTWEKLRMQKGEHTSDMVPPHQVALFFFSFLFLFWRGNDEKIYLKMTLCWGQQVVNVFFFFAPNAISRTLTKFAFGLNGKTRWKIMALLSTECWLKEGENEGEKCTECTEPQEQATSSTLLHFKLALSLSLRPRYGAKGSIDYCTCCLQNQRWTFCFFKYKFCLLYRESRRLNCCAARETRSRSRLKFTCLRCIWWYHEKIWSKFLAFEQFKITAFM